MIGNLSKKGSAAAIAALAAAGTLMVPGMAGAQSYGSGYPSAYGYGQSQTYYDPCVRDQRERQTAGGLVGATIGAIAGSQIAARGRRTEGSILGGVLGAAVGAGVGRGQAACSPSYDNRYDNRYGGSYGYYEQSDYGRPYDQGYYEPNYRTRVYEQPYNDRDYGYPVQDRGYQNADQCRLAESVIRLPDGRTENRYVRTCPDEYGRYRVVD